QFEANFPGGDDEAVALIDIGASIMKTNVLRKGATIFARDIPFGGNNYTQAIAQRLSIAFEQAEAAKVGKDVGVKWETLVPPLNLGVVFAIVYVATVGGIGVYWWSLVAEETRIAAEVDRLARELQSLKATLGAGANVKGQLGEVKRRVDILEELTRGQGRSIALLDAFADTVPTAL